jgi:hypothetical protein
MWKIPRSELRGVSIQFTIRYNKKDITGRTARGSRKKKRFPILPVRFFLVSGRFSGGDWLCAG